ncbi:MAG TPA: hypothetical protein VFX86_03390 [Candidatus Saccharimonadales bacterium]|nr:hypothetical protein [Candidatus Saccharimonadales bacterium]
MPPFLIAAFAAVGIGAWVYNKAMRYTGNNTQNSLAVAIASGVIVFIVVLTIISFTDSALES